MEKRITGFLALLLLVTLSSCSAIEGIFKAGMFTGILIIVVIVALLIWVISRVSKK